MNIIWTLTESGTAKLADIKPINKADENWIGFLKLNLVMRDGDAQALVDEYDFEWSEDFIQI